MDVSQLEGTVLTHYRIEERIGEGGMGIVYRAFDTILRRRVALKILSSDLLRDPGHRHRFEQEARAASSISHGNVAHIYEVGETGGESFIVMEYVEGQTLARLMKTRALELREIFRIALQMADALDVAHSKGITHRDIKPGNIMITARGEVKVLDFGLARMSTAPAMDDATAAMSGTIPGTILGTAPYMSPEQALGHRVDHRSDIFSVGAVLYEMVTRKPAFGGSTFMETLMAVVNEEPEAIEAIAPSTPPELISIIRRCLNKDKQDRYDTTTELLEDLRDIQGLQQSTHGHSAPTTFHERTRTPLPAPGRRVPSRRLIVTVAVLALGAVVAALAWWTLVAGTRYDSVAVMPFVNQSNDPEFEYLADGITESVIQGVSKLRKVRVVSRSSTFSFKGKQFDIDDVARKLNVDAILTGTLTVKDGMMRVSAELTDVASRGHVWGQQYTRPMAGAFVVQEDIAQEIATRLRSDLTGEEHELVRGKRYTDSSEAYRLYLKGRYYWNKRTSDGLKASIDFFQQAIDQDPTYALAYAGMADSYMLMSNVMPPGEAFGRAKAAAQKALAIDNKLAEPYATLGYVSLHYDWNWKEAETNLKKAADLNPNYPTARSLYARYLTVMGKFPESVREMQKAQQLDPLALGISTGVGLCHYYGRQYDDAISAFNKALELNPKFQLALLDRGDAYAQKRQFKEAFESFDQAIALSSKDAGAIAQRGRAYAIAGRRPEALAAIAQLEEIAGQRYVSPYFFALVYSGLRDVNGTLTYLERGVNERTSPMVFANVDPAWDVVRKAPRFRALMSRMNF